MIIGPPAEKINSGKPYDHSKLSYNLFNLNLSNNGSIKRENTLDKLQTLSDRSTAVDFKS